MYHKKCAYLNVSLRVAHVLDHSVPFKMVELNGASACVSFVNGRLQLGRVISQLPRFSLALVLELYC